MPSWRCYGENWKRRWGECHWGMGGYRVSKAEAVDGKAPLMLVSLLGTLLSLLYTHPIPNSRFETEKKAFSLLEGKKPFVCSQPIQV